MCASQGSGMKGGGGGQGGLGLRWDEMSTREGDHRHVMEIKGCVRWSSVEWG